MSLRGVVKEWDRRFHDIRKVIKWLQDEIAKLWDEMSKIKEQKLTGTKDSLKRLEEQQRLDRERREEERQRMEEERQKREDELKQAAAADKQRHEEQMAKFREEQREKIKRMDEERKREREGFNRTVEAAKEESKRYMAKMDVDKLQSRRDVMLPKLILARKNYGRLFDDFYDAALEHARIKAKVQAEEERLSQFQAVRHDSDCKRIILFGGTGEGKSSFACRLTGNTGRKFEDGAFAVSNSTESVTQSIKAVLVDNTQTKVSHLKYSNKFVVVDVPGTGDTAGEDIATQHTNRIVNFLKGIEFINCVGLVKSGSSPRLSLGTRDMLASLVKVFGPKIWAHVVLVITKVQAFYPDPEDAIAAKEEMDQWVIDFKKSIRTHFDIAESDAPLPEIRIDNKVKADYTEKCHAFIEDKVMLMDSYRCDELTSDLDIWKNMETEMQTSVDEAKDKMKRAITIVNAFVNEVQNIEKHLKGKSTQGVSVESLEILLIRNGCDSTLVELINEEEVVVDVDTKKQRAFDSAYDAAKTSYVTEDDEKKEE